MKRWHIRVTGEIDDTTEVDAETEDEAIESALDDWSFVEASSWDAKVIDVEDLEWLTPRRGDAER